MRARSCLVAPVCEDDQGAKRVRLTNAPSKGQGDAGSSIAEAGSFSGGCKRLAVSSDGISAPSERGTGAACCGARPLEGGKRLRITAVVTAVGLPLGAHSHTGSANLGASQGPSRGYQSVCDSSSASVGHLVFGYRSRSLNFAEQYSRWQGGGGHLRHRAIGPLASVPPVIHLT